MNDDQLFYAWLDGELDGEVAAQVAARVAADPALTRRAEQHRRLEASLRGSFDAVVTAASPPPRFETADVIDLGQRRDAKLVRRSSFGGPQWAAMAATLAIGIITGTMIAGHGPVESRHGQLLAAASLEQALDHQLASAGPAGDIRIGLTYRDRHGAVCRSFDGSAGAGVACRAGQEWQVKGLFAPSAAPADYRMAAGTDPRLAALIDDSIAGEPLDAAGEASAAAHGWR